MYNNVTCLKLHSYLIINNANYRLKLKLKFKEQCQQVNIQTIPITMTIIPTTTTWKCEPLWTAAVSCKQRNMGDTLQIKLHSQHATWAYRPNIFAYIYYIHQNKTNCNFYSISYFQICTRNKYAHQITHIAMYAKCLTCIYGGYMHIYATWVTGINLATRSTVQIFDINSITNKAATFWI